MTWRKFTAPAAGGATITMVALDLGYESVPAFITMFKRMLGVAPRAYLLGVKSATV